MNRGVFSRRALIGTLVALGVAPSAEAQDRGEALAWVRAATTTWVEILQIPMGVVRTASGLSANSVADNERELSEARVRAAAKRAEMESEIGRCRAMVAATPSPPRFPEADVWEQAIVDQVAGDQQRALDRLAAMAVFLESNSNDYVSGRAPFAAAMRMSNWSLFGEQAWIMASLMKPSRLGQEQNGFIDLWYQATSLDWLASSIVQGEAIRIVHGDPPAHIAEAQSALGAVASEMRQIAALLSAAAQRPLHVAGDAGLRLRRALPHLPELAENQAQALEEIARAWPSLSPADLIADGARLDHAPSFVEAAGPLVGDTNQPT